MPNTLLDVDESLIKRSLMLPELQEEGEEFDRLLRTLETPTPSVVFRPIPGICIKTKAETGEKVFVNLCQTTEIEAPEDISDDEFYKRVNEDPAGWRIPISIGNERKESDKTGAQCPTYDAVINAKFFAKCEEKRHFLGFVILAALSVIEEKYDKVLDSERYVILKNKKVVGKLQDHRIMKREKKPTENPARKPLIEEIPDSETRSQEEKSVEKPVTKGAEVPDDSSYVIFKKPKEGEAKELIGFFKLPPQCSEKDIRADIGEDRIIVDAKESDYLVDVFVPFSIDQNSTTATLDPTLNILRLDMPVTSAQQ